MPNEVNDSAFFRWILFSLTAIVILAFPLHALVNTDNLSTIRLSLHVHAISFGAWYVLACTQATLISKMQVSLHRKLAYLTAFIVPLMIVSALWVSYENSVRTGLAVLLIAGVINASAFSVFFLTAMIKRKTPCWHQRMIVFASISIMFPAFARVAYVFGVSNILALPLWLGFIIAVIVFDKRKFGHLSNATWFGIAVSVIQFVLLAAFSSPE